MPTAVCRTHIMSALYRVQVQDIACKLQVSMRTVPRSLLICYESVQFSSLLLTLNVRDGVGCKGRESFVRMSIY